MSDQQAARGVSAPTPFGDGDPFDDPSTGAPVDGRGLGEEWVGDDGVLRRAGATKTWGYDRATDDWVAEVGPVDDRFRGDKGVLRRPGETEPHQMMSGRHRLDATQDMFETGSGTRTSLLLSRDRKSVTGNRMGTAIAAHLDGRTDADADTMMATLRQAEQSGKPVTVLAANNGDVEVWQGRVKQSSDGELVVALKSNPRNGMRLEQNTVELLAVEDGFTADQVGGMHDRWKQMVAAVPDLAPADTAGIPVYDGSGHPPSNIAAAYICDAPDFGGGGDRRGSVFFVTDHEPDLDGDGGVVNGYHWFPENSGAYSEHGSMYTRDLVARAARVRGDFDGSGLTFGSVMDTEHRARPEMMAALKTWSGQTGPAS